MLRERQKDKGKNTCETYGFEETKKSKTVEHYGLLMKISIPLSKVLNPIFNEYNVNIKKKKIERWSGK